MSLCTIRRTPEVELVPAATVLLVARAFKLEDGHFGQLTYQGSLKKGPVHFSTGAPERESMFSSWWQSICVLFI
jgi:hypothetical protein